MKEYLVEIFDEISVKYIYLKVVSETKKQARKIAYASRDRQVDYMKESIHYGFYIDKRDYKVQKAYEIGKDIAINEYSSCLWFGNAPAFGESDVKFLHL